MSLPPPMSCIGCRVGTVTRAIAGAWLCGSCYGITEEVSAIGGDGLGMLMRHGPEMLTRRKHEGLLAEMVKADCAREQERSS